MITEALTRPLGPLAAWQWALVLAGGYVGYRYLTGQGIGGGSKQATTTDLSQLGSNIIQGPQGEPGPPGPPGPAGTTGTNPPVNVKSTLWGSDVPASIQKLDPTGKLTAGLFSKLHLGYGTVINMSDLKAAFAKAHLSYGSVIEPADVANLLKKYGIKTVVPPGPLGATGPTSTSNTQPGSIPNTIALSSIQPLTSPVSNPIAAVSTTIGNQTTGQPPSTPTRLAIPTG